MDEAVEQKVLVNNSLENETVGIQWNPTDVRRLPLCHHRIAKQACRKLNGIPMGAPLGTSAVSSQLLRDQFLPVKMRFLKCGLPWAS